MPEEKTNPEEIQDPGNQPQPQDTPPLEEDKTKTPKVKKEPDQTQPPKEEEDVFVSGEPSKGKKPPVPPVDDEELAPEDAQLIDKRVDEKVKPLTDALFKQQRESELQAFLVSEDGKFFKEYEPKIKKYAQDPRLKDVKIDAIAGMVARKDLLKIGAKKASEADTEAKVNETGGSSARQTQKSEIPDVTDMSSEDFNKLKEEVKMGRFQQK